MGYIVDKLGLDYKIWWDNQPIETIVKVFKVVCTCVLVVNKMYMVTNWKSCLLGMSMFPVFGQLCSRLANQRTGQELAKKLMCLLQEDGLWSDWF